MQEPCRHERIRLIARDEAAEYVECMDCGSIFERDELEEPPLFEEDLSDA